MLPPENHTPRRKVFTTSPVGVPPNILAPSQNDLRQKLPRKNLKLTSLLHYCRSWAKHFESLIDPRDTRNRRHLLVDVIVISVCGVIVGCKGPTSIERWAKAKQEWLEELLELPGGIPSRDCIRRILSALKPEAFQKCFGEWIAACLICNNDHTTRTIAIDGKTMRRSHDKAAGLGALHIVSAWASEQGIALGQLATEEKSNEITAIPELLEQIDVKDSVVTIDAMGCQKTIAKKITACGGDYVLAVKGNQKTLYKTIRELFLSYMEDDFAHVQHRKYETHDKSHGRIEDRGTILLSCEVTRRFPTEETVAEYECDRNGDQHEDRQRW